MNVELALLADYAVVAQDGKLTDLREAFDEFIVAWLDAGRRIPEPRRGFTIPSSVGQRLAKESSETGCLDRMKGERESSWADTVKLYTGDIVVRDSADEPLLTEELATAVG